MSVTNRERIWRTPFLRRRVCRERMSQATRVEAFAFHGGATLPESHRLRWNPAYEIGLQDAANAASEEGLQGASRSGAPAPASPAMRLSRHVLLCEPRVVGEV